MAFRAISRNKHRARHPTKRHSEAATATATDADAEAAPVRAPATNPGRVPGEKSRMAETWLSKESVDEYQASKGETRHLRYCDGPEGQAGPPGDQAKWARWDFSRPAVFSQGRQRA